MAKIPSPYSISGASSLRPNSPAPVADMSGLTRGVENLAGSFNKVVAKERDKQNTIDIAAAEAFSTKSFLDMENQFQQDGDYATIAERAEKGSQDITNNAATMIRDPEMRARWVAASEVQRIRQVDALGDIGRGKANEAERVSFLTSLDGYADLITEPSVPDDIRNKARADLAGTIDVAEQQGLLTPTEAQKARIQYIDNAETQLALNVGDALVRADPQAVIEGTGIAPTGDPLTDARTAVRIPVVTADGINLADINPVVLTRYEQLQSVFGTQLPVISAERTPEHNAEVGGADQSHHLAANGGDAIDIDVSRLSKEERVQLIETASAMGFGGIGVYANSLHLDTRQGTRAAWGPSFGNGSIPEWAREVLDRHTGGTISEVPVGVARGVDPRFAALDYQQRATLFDQAKRATEQQNMQMQAGIETTVENAPAAIARTGGYDGNLPTANDFVQAYGAQQGIERFEAFDASVKVSQDSFAMRTMTAEQIGALVEQSTPTSAGDDAALQEQSFAQVSQAAALTLKAREDDPNLYVQEVYPAVKQAWDAIEDDPAKFSQALTVTALAQETLGIQNPQLLPKAMAANAATMFNNAELSDEERLGALTGLVMSTPKPEQQAAIFEQMVAAGVPPQTRKAMDALARGDEGAAQRLFAAAMVKDLPPKIGDITSTQISTEIEAKLFDTGQIGDIAYDLTYGEASNFNDMTTDLALITNSVKLRLMDGSAGGSVERAIDMTVKDVFGDVQVVNGSMSGGKAGLKALLPTDADTRRYQAGFDALLGQVGEAQAMDLERDVDSALGPVEAGTAGQAIRDAQVANMVEQTLSAGYFTNAGDSVFKFIDPNSGSAVVNSAGEPITFTTDEVLAAGAVEPRVAPGPAGAAGAQFGSQVIRPEGM